MLFGQIVSGYGRQDYIKGVQDFFFCLQDKSLGSFCLCLFGFRGSLVISIGVVLGDIWVFLGWG